MSDQTSPANERVTLKRRRERGAYDRASIHAILDEGLICHVGFVVDGQPFVIPTTYARVGEEMFIHGSAASRMLRETRRVVPICVTVTLQDGLVLARSAFHHSMNYRSVVILGVAHEITGEDEKSAALRALVEHVIPGRWEHVRPPSSAELRATMVLAVPITEASAKVRTGPPLDDEDDLKLPVWAGEIPLRLAIEARRPDADDRGIPEPDYVTNYRRGLPRKSAGGD
jgi:nitroimidazol reductase NimA-like FMN-containing flavoprotein (pyridoxamine 5'-phosphate oxidase superfamily)